MLQALHGFVVAFLDFFLDGGEVGVVSGSERVAGEGERSSAGGGGLEESSSVHGREDNGNGLACKGRKCQPSADSSPADAGSE